MNPRLLELLRRHEALRLKPYTDTVGKLTIGYGRNLTDRGISRTEAEGFLVRDVGETERDLQIRFPWMAGLDDVRWAIMVDMAFNMGVAGLAGFYDTLSLIREGRYAEASEQMMKSRWAQQVGTRAERLRKMMETGEWPNDI